MQKTLLFHDGCDVCLSIESAFKLLFSNGLVAFESVNLGLHTVFEHHDVMGQNALKVFLHEYRITFPVGVDLNRPGYRGGPLG